MPQEQPKKWQKDKKTKKKMNLKKRSSYPLDKYSEMHANTVYICGLFSLSKKLEVKDKKAEKSEFFSFNQLTLWIK